MTWLEVVSVEFGVVLFALFLYGLIRDLRRHGTTQIADRPKPEIGQSIDFLEELRRVGPEERRYPEGPGWEDAA